MGGGLPEKEGLRRLANLSYCPPGAAADKERGKGALVGSSLVIAIAVAIACFSNPIRLALRIALLKWKEPRQCLLV